MAKGGIADKLDQVISKLEIGNEKLEKVIKRDKAFRAKASFWGLLGGAIGSAILWALKFIIYKIIL